MRILSAEKSHFDYLLSLSEQEDIPLAIKQAMEGIEQHKPELVGSLPKDEYFNLEPKEDGENIRDYSLTASLLKIINSIPRDLEGMYSERFMNTSSASSQAVRERWR